MLPKHQAWDHEIPLKKGKQPIYRLIYTLSEEELEVLRNYIKENLKKGFIKPFILPAGYLLFFTRKKNNKLKPYIDYRQLNAITIKNRYPLPVILELQIRITGVKVFTKINIRKIYYRIRIKSGKE